MNSTPALATDLQELHLQMSNTTEELAPSPRVETIRKRIPKPVLDHFDRMRLRGRKPIAVVRHAVCTACHLQIPKSHILQMRRSGEIDVCDNCGTFIYLEKAEYPGSE
ncbi:MAG: hypothetical protein LV479_10425 [Methylacidiphilales bacterium]|nr:hypothetical protein [Candidatus Methylacidiphilales bacterium]